jgi:hypothetical protein
LKNVINFENLIHDLKAISAQNFLLCTLMNSLFLRYCDWILEHVIKWLVNNWFQRKQQIPVGNLALFVISNSCRFGIF